MTDLLQIAFNKDYEYIKSIGVDPFLLVLAVRVIKNDLKDMSNERLLKFLDSLHEYEAINMYNYIKIEIKDLVLCTKSVNNL